MSSEMPENTCGDSSGLILQKQTRRQTWWSRLFVVLGRLSHVSSGGFIFSKCDKKPQEETEIRMSELCSLA